MEAEGKTLDMDFVVIDALSSDNAITGRCWIHKMEGVVSTLHQVMRCITPDGRSVVDIRGDQLMAQMCYNMATEVGEEPKKE